MAKTKITTDDLIVDKIAAKGSFITISARIKGVAATEDDDFVIKSQLATEDDEVAKLAANNTFDGENQFTQPITAVAASTDEEVPTLGQVKSLIGNRPAIAVTETQKTIAWQTDKVDGVKTFAEVFGNTIFKALLVGEDGSGYTVAYEGNLRYNKTGALINQLIVENILYTGKLTFI